MQPPPQALADQFAITAGDTKPGAVPLQQAFDQRQGHFVRFCVDGPDYFKSIEKEISDLLLESSDASRFFYISAWWLGLIDVNKTVMVDPDIPGSGLLASFTDALNPWPAPVDFPPFILPGSRALLDRLVEMSSKGIDVRVLSWVSPFASKYKQVADRSEGIAGLNLHTLLSTQALRNKFGASGHIMLNLLSHPLGAAHLKVVVCGNATSMRAYSGGMDPVSTRMEASWHDAAVCFEGPAAAHTYEYFRQLWNEQRKRDPEVFILDNVKIASHLDSTPEIPQRKALPARDQTHSCVQVLRTVPTMNFSLLGPEWLEPNVVQRAALVNLMGFKKPPLSFAPEGIFEFKAAMHKMIAAAHSYIFITDQCFSSQEVMDWLNVRLTDGSNVKVILLYGPDPHDPPSGSMQEAINAHLLKNVEESGQTRSGFKNLACFKWDRVVVHSKVTIVDDVACIIGSANCGMRRSFYTDIEHSVSIVDVGAAQPIKQLRQRMWARYCNTDWAEVPADAQDALYIWDNGWTPEGPPRALKLIPGVKQYFLPATGAGYSKQTYDQQDPDSREEF
jgi:phosphatidylserine/phosphatidylglycerophosphate/cardiolipin synthase-like enzyme